MSHRPTVYGTRHAVSAGHYLAASAAFSILEAGGNAIDAGCAAGIALGVLQPDLVNVAGVAPIMIRLAERSRGEHRRSRLVAEDTAGRHLHARARRQDPRRRAAHRHPSRARCVDHRAAAPRHDALRRCRVVSRSATPARASRCIRCSPSRSRRTSTNTGAGNPTPRSFCPADRVPQCRGEIRAVRSGAHAAIHGRSGPRRRARPRGRAARRRTMRSIAATSRARSSAFQQREGGYLSHGGPRRVSVAHRAGGAAVLARARGDHLRPVVPGARAAARLWHCWSASASPGCRTIRRTTCIGSPSA